MLAPGPEGTSVRVFSYAYTVSFEPERRKGVEEQLRSFMHAQLREEYS